MAKNNDSAVVFVLLNDGYAPRQMGNIGFAIMNPHLLVIQPNQTINVKLGVSADKVLFVWNRSREIGGLWENPSVLPPNTELTVKITNDSQVPIIINDAQPLLNVVPIVWDGQHCIQ